MRVILLMLMTVMCLASCEKEIWIDPGERSRSGELMDEKHAETLLVTVTPPTSGDVCLTSLDLMFPVYVGTVFPIRQILLNDGSVVKLDGSNGVNFMKFSLEAPSRLNLLNRNVVANIYWEQNVQVDGVAKSFKYDVRGFGCDYVSGSTLDRVEIPRPFPGFPGVGVPVLPVRPLPGTLPGLPIWPLPKPKVPFEPVREPEYLQTVTFHLFSTLRYIFKAEIPYASVVGGRMRYVVGLWL